MEERAFHGPQVPFQAPELEAAGERNGPPPGAARFGMLREVEGGGHASPFLLAEAMIWEHRRQAELVELQELGGVCHVCRTREMLRKWGACMCVELGG